MLKPKGANDQNPFFLHQNSTPFPFSNHTSPNQKKSEQTETEADSTTQTSKKSEPSGATIPAVKLFDMNEAAEVIEQLGLIDLRKLNKLIVDRINNIVNKVNDSIISGFHVGNKVSFKSKTGVIKTGTVIRINKKTISVAIEGDDGWWNVSPHALERI